MVVWGTSQVLSLVEQVVLMYRTLVTVPCWLFYFQSIGMGDVLTSCLNGKGLRLQPARTVQFVKALRGRALTSPALFFCRSVLVVQGAHPFLGGDGGLRVCEGYCAATVCVWPACGSDGSSAHGERQDLPNLPGNKLL